MASPSTRVASQAKGKGPMVQPQAPLTLQILNQINDEMIEDPQPQLDDARILIPFNIGDETHCFVGPIQNLERAHKRIHYFPNAQGEDLLINQNLVISHFINPQKPFRNNPKVTPRGADFKAWHRHLELEKNNVWRAFGIQDLLRISHFTPITYPWMIGAVVNFSNRTTNNFYLACGTIGPSLLDVAAITGLPISFS
ncbi:hypothetical protein Ahy_B10g102002 [Arachis hypogaea]|uniref:Aminotransferase-like plant mobile domain-containing protein n=1 Tax=Arachis hypogaea TaxID=3818 RepID=A0A444X0Z4_ARAHY|nr:hypothetical protein Ahy_B10g102002 [Arachis hypogaea]